MCMALHILSSLCIICWRKECCVGIYYISIYRSACSKIQFNKRDFVFPTYFPVCVFLIWYFRMYANMHLWLVFRKMFYIFFMPSPLFYLSHLSSGLALYFCIHSIWYYIHIVLCCQTSAMQMPHEQLCYA